MRLQYEIVKSELRKIPKTWVVTGVAGFIGSHILHQLLSLSQRVVGLDNLSTGNTGNLSSVLNSVSGKQAARFDFIEGDITDWETCEQCCKGADIVLHQAALGSVPASIEEPIKANKNNIDGFVNMLEAGKQAGVKRFVYASSSAVYGDFSHTPLQEEYTGNLLSPYALTKKVNEMYAEVFYTVYGMETVGLRYFNIFGSRQDPNGAYAAVIPQWFSNILKGLPVYINGDGETVRDFCYVDDVVQANILAACTDNKEAFGNIFNIGLGNRTTLNELFQQIRECAADRLPAVRKTEPIYRGFREGDIRVSEANINKAKDILGYCPLITVQEGLRKSAEWYSDNL